LPFLQSGFFIQTNRLLASYLFLPPFYFLEEHLISKWVCTGHLMFMDEEVYKQIEQAVLDN